MIYAISSDEIYQYDRRVSARKTFSRLGSIGSRAAGNHARLSHGMPAHVVGLSELRREVLSARLSRGENETGGERNPILGNPPSRVIRSIELRSGTRVVLKCV